MGALFHKTCSTSPLPRTSVRNSKFPDVSSNAQETSSCFSDKGTKASRTRTVALPEKFRHEKRPKKPRGARFSKKPAYVPSRSSLKPRTFGILDTISSTTCSLGNRTRFRKWFSISKNMRRTYGKLRRKHWKCRSSKISTSVSGRISTHRPLSKPVRPF